MVSDSCQHVLFLAWTFAVTQLSMNYWYYRIHLPRLKWISCVLSSLWSPLKSKNGAPVGIRLLLNMTVCIWCVSCNLAVCISPSAVRSAFPFIWRHLAQLCLLSHSDAYRTEELSAAYLFLQQKLGKQWVMDVSSCHFDHWSTQVIWSLKTKNPTTKQTQLHASVISLSNSHFLYLPLDWHCCQALMEEGKSNSFNITHCCLLCDLFPVDSSIYLGDKENTEACEVYLLDRSELTETFFSSFSPSPHSQSAFCFYKVIHVFFFEI